jgi:hypothetical protein
MQMASMTHRILQLECVRYEITSVIWADLTYFVYVKRRLYNDATRVSVGSCRCKLVSRRL